MTKDEFRKLQLTQLEIMDEIHRVCVENDITYYMIGGTALGAVRHKGFIPWDLDIDIAMKRKDYDKFKDVCKTALNDRFTYRDYLNTKNYPNPHAIICVNNTVLVNKFEKYNPEMKNMGIYLDIFPLDNAPIDDKERVKHAKKLNRIKKLKQYKVGMRYEKNFIKTFAKKFISNAIFWTSIDKINAKMDRCMRKYNCTDTGYVCSMASHYSYEKQFMKEEIYGNPKLIKFEDREYFCLQETDEYLTRIYKDYMKLPPENERNANLDVFDSVVFDTKEA